MIDLLTRNRVFALAFYLGFKLMISGKGSVENVGTILIVVMSVMMIVFGISQTAPPLINISKAERSDRFLRCYRRSKTKQAWAERSGSISPSRYRS